MCSICRELWRLVVGCLVVAHRAQVNSIPMTAGSLFYSYCWLLSVVGQLFLIERTMTDIQFQSLLALHFTLTVDYLVLLASCSSLTTTADIQFQWVLTLCFTLTIDYLVLLASCYRYSIPMIAGSLFYSYHQLFRLLSVGGQLFPHWALWPIFTFHWQL